jgi:hypothetical protein
MDQYKASGLYLVFVDFKAAFDTIDRALLFDKLRDMGALDEHFLKLFKASLHGVSAAIKQKDIKWFHENVGVKQGCSSGPRSFVSFIHDLPACVCPEDCTGDEFAIHLMHKIIRCLLWADDLVLWSRTEKGIQAQLDALAVYVKHNKLTVNTDKTESMFVCSRKNVHPYPNRVFKYESVRLKHVSKYKYVGVCIERTGLFNVHVHELITKARKAMYSCMSKVSSLSPRCPAYMKMLMFKTYVLNILLYACEVIPYTKAQIAQLNDIVLKYARWATGLPTRAKINAVLCEAGLRPLQFDIDLARANYFVLLHCRDLNHVTNSALASIRSMRGICKMRNWHTAM